MAEFFTGGESAEGTCVAQRKNSAMSPSNKPVALMKPGRTYAVRRHRPAPVPPSNPDGDEEPAALPLVRHILELEALGWHVVRLRPSRTGDEPPLWHVTIERYDEGATMTMTEADPDAALAELVRYAQADAT